MSGGLGSSHTKDTFLSAFYRRLQVRKGAPKAVMALAHHMIAIVYNVLKRSEEYVELGGDYYDQQSKPKVVSRLVKRLTRLGYAVTLEPAQTSISQAPAGTPPVLAAPEPRVRSTPSSDSAPIPSTESVRDPVPMRKPSQTIKQSLPADNRAVAARKRGRPCLCSARGIVCKHLRGLTPNSLNGNAVTEGTFS